jgi:hypothetical protein
LTFLLRAFLHFRIGRHELGVQLGLVAGIVNSAIESLAVDGGVATFVPEPGSELAPCVVGFVESVGDRRSARPAGRKSFVIAPRTTRRSRCRLEIGLNGGTPDIWRASGICACTAGCQARMHAQRRVTAARFSVNCRERGAAALAEHGVRIVDGFA